MVFGEQCDEAESHRILDFAWDHGINMFDTAEIYPVSPRAETQGRSSRIVGSWLRRSGRKREDVIIASKVR